MVKYNKRGNRMKKEEGGGGEGGGWKVIFSLNIRFFWALFSFYASKRTKKIFFTKFLDKIKFERELLTLF